MANGKDDNCWKICQDFFYALIEVTTALIMSVIRFVVPKNKKTVRNKVVLITGAGNGIGRQLSIEFVKLGASVILWDKCLMSLNRTVEIIHEQLLLSQIECVRVHRYLCNVGDRDDVYRVGERVKEEVGDIDILVNNAAVVCGKSVLDLPDQRIHEIFKVNLLALFWTVKCFMPAMLHRNEGHIVNVASSCGLAGINKLLPYSASKFGVIGFSEVLNYENTFSGHEGVKVTIVCPTFVKTGLFEGCSMKYQSIVPDLEVVPTVARIMEGILREEHYVYIPGYIGIVPLCKSLLPNDAWLAVHKFMGAEKFMDSFVGRQETITDDEH